MENNWDEGLQEDFDFMTLELGREVDVYKKDYEMTYEGFENENTDLSLVSKEIVFLQELNSTHEVVLSGQLNVGDVRFTFQSDTEAEEEGYVKANGNTYRIQTITRVRGMTNDKILYVKAFGKKIPNR